MPIPRTAVQLYQHDVYTDKLAQKEYHADVNKLLVGTCTSILVLYVCTSKLSSTRDQPLSEQSLTVSASGQIPQTIHRHRARLKTSASETENGLWHWLFHHYRHICRSLFNSILSVHENKTGMESRIFYFWEYFFSRKTGYTSFLPCSCYLLMSSAKRMRALIEYQQSQILLQLQILSSQVMKTVILEVL